MGWGDKEAVGNCFKINIFKKVVALYTLKAGHGFFSAHARVESFQQEGV